MGLLYLTDEVLETIGLSEVERQTVAHYKRVITQREILPMVHPELKDDAGLPLIVPTIIPPRTTEVVTKLIEAIRTISGEILQANSNWCQCARRYMILEDTKATWLQMWAKGENDPETGKPVSKTRLEKKLTETDRMIQQLFKGDIPSQWALTAHDPPCPHCGKPRLIDRTMAYSEPGFLRNLLNVFLGGDFPLDSATLFLEYLDRTIFNEDVIPPAKKNQVMAVQEKIQIIAIKDKILQWVAKKLLMLEEEDTAMHHRRLEILSHLQDQHTTQALETKLQTLLEIIERLQKRVNQLSHLDKPTSSPPNTSPDSTNTTGENGDGPHMTLTPDFRPQNEASTTTPISNTGEKLQTN